MAKDSIGFGIIGTGAISAQHTAALRATIGARLVAVTDIIPERAQSFGEAQDVDWTTSVDELIGRKDINVINICTPSGTHPELALKAIAAGKHVIVEKPMALTLEDADRVIDAAREAKVKLAVISQRRFEIPVRRLKQAIEEGLLGRVVLGNAHIIFYRSEDYYSLSDWRGTWAMDGGGALMNQGIHTIDLLNWLVGPVESVKAYTDTLAHNIEVEDVASAALRFASGALGTIQGTTAAYPGLFSRLEVMGDKGSVILQDSDVVFWSLTERIKLFPEELTGPRVGSGAASPGAISSAGHHAQFEDMIRAIREDREPMIGGQEARKAIEIILAVYESARTGETVTINGQ